MIKVSPKDRPVFDAFQITGDPEQHECLVETKSGLAILDHVNNLLLLVEIDQWVILQQNKVFAVVYQKDFDRCFQQV